MWAQIINVILGVWLTVAPSVLGSSKIATDNDHIVGPVVASFALIAVSEATRVVRLYNLPPALWLLVAPWVLGYEDTIAIMNDMAVGALVITFALKRGKVSERLGGGWSAVWGKEPMHAREARQLPPQDLGS